MITAKGLEAKEKFKFCALIETLCYENCFKPPWSKCVSFVLNLFYRSILLMAERAFYHLSSTFFQLLTFFHISVVCCLWAWYPLGRVYIDIIWSAQYRRITIEWSFREVHRKASFIPDSQSTKPRGFSVAKATNTNQEWTHYIFCITRSVGIRRCYMANTKWSFSWINICRSTRASIFQFADVPSLRVHSWIFV